MSCCTNTKFLGCFEHCSTINLGVATFTGAITVYVTFADITKTKVINAVEGQPLLLSLKGLNENAEFTMQLRNEEGSVVELTMSEVSYDCFSFKTLIAQSIPDEDDSGGGDTAGDFLDTDFNGDFLIS